MKSLLEFVTCCGCPSSRPDQPQSEETWFLVLPSQPLRPTRTVSRRRRNQRRGSSGSAADWRPSLGAISEDNMVPEREKQRLNAGSGRMLKRKVTSATTTTIAGVRGRNGSSDRFGRSCFPMIIPAFSAAPFMF